jgi:hypothetical protein
MSNMLKAVNCSPEVAQKLSQSNGEAVLVDGIRRVLEVKKVTEANGDQKYIVTAKAPCPSAHFDVPLEVQDMVDQLEFSR